ncbi:MAG: DUF4105 domain-containing protein [Deltaproteobacteria bacterium]|nr:DUF4105 domain-containing protein [Deltaproteobacteria bacterium]
MLRFAIAALVAVFSVGTVGPAAADRRSGPPGAQLERRTPICNGRQEQDAPVVKLVTMGIGSLIWERHGHIALCVCYEDRREDRCYNYGIGDFRNPAKMGWGFFRGTNSFWVGRSPPEEMMAIYRHTDRTIWSQPIALTPAQKTQVIDKLEHDILEENKYYSYDHFWDNCTTRVRDILDDATGGQLKETTNTPTDGKTFRDLARDGFYPMRPALLITDLFMGRTTDRVPNYWERMFLPQYLREAVIKRWNVQPTIVYERQGEAVIADHKLCSDGSIVGQTDVCTPETPSGRVLFAFVVLLLTAPVWLTRLWGRFQRLGLAVAVVPASILGLVLWLIAILSPLPYVRWNEALLILMPFDLLLLFLSPTRRRTYAKGRVVMLGLVAVLMLVGVLQQPLWFILPWTLIPAAVVGFWPAKPVAEVAATPVVKPTKKSA